VKTITSKEKDELVAKQVGSQCLHIIGDKLVNTIP